MTRNDLENETVSVLIVDDSALMRNVIGRIVESAPGLAVAGKAMNGEFALQKIPSLNPDVIILDLEMPQMNGIEFLKERKRRGIEIPVVILSSIAKRGAEVTMEAISLGASDFILKPSGSASEDIRMVGGHIVETVLAYGSQYRRRKKTGMRESARSEPARPPQAPSGTTAGGAAGERTTEGTSVETTEARSRVAEAQGFPKPARPSAPVSNEIHVVAIGISTGGPNALREVFAGISASLPVPVLVVQHMPAGFTEEFAKSLDRLCPLDVKEAADGDILAPGRVLVAPGHSHLELERKPLATIVRLSQDPPVNGHRPSVDVLFSSVAKCYGPHTLAVIMTGMGRDGAREIGTIYNLGGTTVAQDGQSSVVYGMPRVAIESGYIQHIVPLRNMADTINKLVAENGPS